MYIIALHQRSTGFASSLKGIWYRTRRAWLRQTFCSGFSVFPSFLASHPQVSSCHRVGIADAELCFAIAREPGSSLALSAPCISPPLPAVHLPFSFVSLLQKTESLSQRPHSVRRPSACSVTRTDHSCGDARFLQHCQCSIGAPSSAPSSAPSVLHQFSISVPRLWQSRHLVLRNGHIWARAGQFDLSCIVNSEFRKRVGSISQSQTPACGCGMSRFAGQKDIGVSFRCSIASHCPCCVSPPCALSLFLGGGVHNIPYSLDEGSNHALRH